MIRSQERLTLAEYHSIPKLIGDHFGVHVKRNGDNFWVDLGIISGSGITSGSGSFRCQGSLRGRGSFRGMNSSASQSLCQMRTLTISPDTQAREIAEATTMQRLYGAEVGAKKTGGTLKGVQV